MRALRRVFFVGDQINAPTALTLLSVVLGAASVLLAYHGHLPWAAIALMGAGICDLFDGFVARRCRVSGAQAAFGVQIDSLADMASFAVAPMYLLLHAGLNGLVAEMAMAAYMVAAALRLAYFNTHGTETRAGRRYYTGLPVTYAALIFPLVLLVCTNADGLHSTWPLQAAVIATALAFVVRMPIPKPTGIAYAVLPAAALLVSALWLARL